MHFLAPARRGETLVFMAACNRAWRTSMEIGIKVVSENYRTGTRVHILSAQSPPMNTNPANALPSFPIPQSKNAASKRPAPAAVIG